MSILTFIIILLLVILVHEFGHFIVAKKAGVRVDEFGFGFPPKLFGKRFGETEYTFNLLPIGGFVRIFGENPADPEIEGPDKDRSFVSKPKWAQAAVLVAGVVMNFVLAWVMFMAVFAIGAPFSTSGEVPAGGEIKNVELKVTYVEPESPADSKGLLPGDTIASISSTDASVTDPTLAEVQEFVSGHPDEAIEVSYQRGSQAIEIVDITPILNDDLGRPVIGIAMDTVGILELPIHRAVIEGTKYTFVSTGNIAVQLFHFFKGIFTREVDFGQVAGPVGLAKIVDAAAQQGIVPILILIAVISINLGIINLLPIPALDGGRLLFLLIEVIQRKPIKPTVAQTVNSIGFILLVLLMVVVTYFDIF